METKVGEECGGMTGWVGLNSERGMEGILKSVKWGGYIGWCVGEVGCSR